MSSPLYERTAGNYGSAPYEESAFRTALRILGGAARGAVAAPGQGGVLGGFFTGFDASARASDEARRAAEAYAMKQQEAEDRRLHQEMQRKFMEAQIEAQKKPPKPEDPFKGVPWYVRPQFKDTPEGISARRKAEYIAPPKSGGKSTKYKPPPPPPRTGDAMTREGVKVNVEDMKDLEQIMNATDSPTDVMGLTSWANSPLTPPSVRAAAKQKLKELGYK